MALVIRDSVEADVGAIEEIYGWYVTHGLASFEEVAPSIDDLAQRRRDVLAHGFPHLAAELDGRVVGYSYATLYRTRSAYRHTLENSVYVHRDAPKRGIGRALLAELIARCERLGARQMIAVIGDSANAASIGLHAALGFEHAGLLKSVGFKHGRWVDSVLMQRSLGAGDTAAPG